MAQVVKKKNLPAMQESQVLIPGWDLWVRKIPWRSKWQPPSVFLPGKFHGQRRLTGYSPRDPKELATTEQLTLSLP